ncbi:hypothetical protein [Streptomyces inhibens]
MALLEEGVRLERVLAGPNPHVNVAEALLGLAYCMSGKVDSAIGILQESKADSEAHGERWLLSWSLVWLGLTGWLQGHHKEATASLRDALRDKHALSDLLGIATAVEYLAWTAVAVADAERGARLLGACQTLWEPLVAYLGGFQVPQGDRGQAGRRGAHGRGARGAHPGQARVELPNPSGHVDGQAAARRRRRAGKVANGPKPLGRAPRPGTGGTWFPFWPAAEVWNGTDGQGGISHLLGQGLSAQSRRSPGGRGLLLCACRAGDPSP